MAKGTKAIEADIRQRLERCRLSARGLWHEMRYLIEQQRNTGRRGHLWQGGSPILDHQLAVMAGCTSGKATQLLQVLLSAGLIEKSSNSYHSPLLTRIAEVQASGAERKARSVAKTGVGVLRNTQKVLLSPSVTPKTKEIGCYHPSPPLTPSPDGFPPITPLPLPPPPIPTSSLFPATAGDNAGREKPGRKSAPKPDKPPAEYTQLTDFWQQQWTLTHGGQEVSFATVDGVVIAALWSRVGKNLGTAKAALSAYLSDSSKFYEGHPLTKFKPDMMKFITRSSSPNGARYANAKSTPAARGEYSEPLPLGVRSLDE